MGKLLSIEVKTSNGEFKVGETISTRTASSVVRGVNKVDDRISVDYSTSGTFQVGYQLKINVDKPDTGSFVVGTEIRGQQSQAIGNILSVNEVSSLDFLTLFGDTLPTDFSYSDYILGLDLGIDFTPDISTTALKKAASDILSGGSIDSIKESISGSIKSNISDITGQATNLIGGLSTSLYNQLNETISGVSGTAGELAGGITGSAGSAVVGTVGDLTDLFDVNPKFAQALEQRLNRKISVISSSIENSVKKIVKEKLNSLNVDETLTRYLNAPLSEINKLKFALFSRIDALENRIPDLGTINNIIDDVLGKDTPDIIRDLVRDIVKDTTEEAIDDLGLRAISSGGSSSTKVVTDVLGSTDLKPDLSFTASSVSRDVSTDPSVAVDSDLTATRENPLNPGTSGLSMPSDRHRTNIANEPVDKFEGQYPHNKSYRSESGHLIEIDDTPGKERLLDQHISGTYVEMKPEGDLVTKVVKDNYTIICGDDAVSIEGQAVIHVTGDCQLRIGGFLTISADKGINVVTKGDFRLKAKSINMESSSGDISARSANNLLLTSVETTHSKSKKNLIETVQETSLKTGQNLIIESDRISQFSINDMILQANKEINISAGKDLSLISKEKINSAAIGNYNIKTDGEILATSKGDYNIKTDAKFLASSGSDFNMKSGGKVIATGTTMEVDATLNAKGTTNLQGVDPQGGTVTPITGQGASAASDPEVAATAAIYKPDVSVRPVESLGSGITYIEDPDKFFEANDDDPETSAVAIREALVKGIITKEELDEFPEEGESDTSPPPPKEIILNQATIKIDSPKDIDNIRLSSNYTVGQLSKYTAVSRYSVIPQKGLTVQQIIQNLQLVAQNCLEKIKAKYPDMIVTSGFRQGTGKSQHNLGQAIDMQFPRHKPSDYFEIAIWIKENVPYDQLLLEYKSSGTKLPWIHISFVGKGNRNQALTLHNNATKAAGLKNLIPKNTA